MKIVERGLSSVIEAFGTERTQKVLSEFVCVENLEVQDYIRNRAIDHERRRLSKTILVFDEDCGSKIVGFYSLSIKSMVLYEHLSSSKKKRVFGTSQTNGDVIPSILIGQLGKNDAVDSAFTGADLMDLIFRYIYKADKYLSSIVSYVEHNGSDKLIKYYEKHGFEAFRRPNEEEQKGLFCHFIRTESIVRIVTNRLLKEVENGYLEEQR